MFSHNFKYSLKILLKNKMLIFWTLAFPIILGTFFNMAFKDIENNEKLKTISIAIVENQEFQNQEMLEAAFDSLDIKKNDQGLFDIQYVSLEKAEELLNNDEITGYILYKEHPIVTIKNSGINETILKNTMEQLNETITSYQSIISREIKKDEYQTITNFDEVISNILLKIQNSEEYKVFIQDTSNKNLSYTMIEYYTLIAMACLYGGMLAMTSMNYNLANMSKEGKRISVSCMKKITLLTSSALASFLIQLVGLSLLFLYTIFILKVDYGPHVKETIILSLLGTIAGLSIGIFVSSIFKTNENTKTGIILASSMTACFLSGMMGITMKYIIDTSLPILNKINPAAMITDGFYALYYYDTLNRYYQNVISLIIFTIIMLGISLIALRRTKYDNI